MSAATLAATQPHRVDEVEEILATAVSTRRATGLVARKFGLSRRQANEYVRAALIRWREESDPEARDEKRALMRETLWDLLQRARDRKGITIDGQGEAHTYADPDTNGAVRAAELLCRLDGLLEQPETPGAINVTVLQHIQRVLMGGEGGEVAALPGEVVEMEQGDG